MKKTIINPWQWQDARNYVQAIEVITPQKTLYISGQTAINKHGIASTAPMPQQLIESIHNLSTVLKTAHYPPSSIVQFKVYTTSINELYPHFYLLQDWLKTNQIKTTLTVIEVKALFETLTIELEAIAVM